MGEATAPFPDGGITVTWGESLPITSARVKEFLAEPALLRHLPHIDADPDRKELVAVTREEQLIAALEDALEGLQEMIGYVPEYFRDKWGHRDYIERAQTVLESIRAHPE